MSYHLLVENMAQLTVVAPVDLQHSVVTYRVLCPKILRIHGAKYTIIDRHVPIYQMALHGFVDYTDESLNLTQNMEEVLLNSAEYGAGLSFTLMESFLSTR